MTSYTLPESLHVEPVPERTAVLVASGDLRLSADQAGWSIQAKMEADLEKAFNAQGWSLKRAHPYDPGEKHGFISSQRMGMNVFRGIHPDAPLVVAEAVWQYSYHVLAGLRAHRGPILTVANWSGSAPGLVGMLNLNGSLTKMGVAYSTLWSKDFTDDFFLQGLQQWLKEGKVTHKLDHVRALDPDALPETEKALGETMAEQIRTEKAIMGIFDEGCMGMYNAIIDDEYLNPLGIYKERLSQSALLAEMNKVSGVESDQVREWLEAKGMTFHTGSDEATELTDRQIRGQLKMYIAATRLADFFGCDCIGIQYQQGLKDMAPASDLAEGLLNNVDRPPVYDPATGRKLFAGNAVVHFNEVDEGAGLDMLVTYRLWRQMGFPPETTLHDIRYGEHYRGDGLDAFVWVFLISGAIPPEHILGGYAGADSLRQPPDYFPLGGGTLRGVSKPGEIVWSRIYLEDGSLKADLGRGSAIALPKEETERRWAMTTPEWPIMHGVLHGVSRDQLMAKHKANHINVVYAPDAESADRALAAKAAMLNAMGIQVFLCGDVNL